MSAQFKVDDEAFIADATHKRLFVSMASHVTETKQKKNAKH